VLVELHTERLENPTVFLRLVPSVIAIDTGFVLIDPQLGHLNLSVISVGQQFISDACNWVSHRGKMLVLHAESP
jgi:hypothetical protein